MAKVFKPILIFLPLLMILLAQCKNQEEENVYYRIGKSAVTKDDVNRVWMGLPDEMKLQFMNKTGRQEILNNLLALELLYQEALRQKLDQDPMIKFRLERMKKNLLAQEVVERALNLEDLYLYYQENFLRLDVIRFESKAQAELNYNLLTSGADFKKIKATINPKENAPDLGYLDRDSLIGRYGTEAATEVFKLGKDQKFTAPIKTGDGWYIFYVLEKTGNLDSKGFESVRNQIVSVKQEEVFRGLVNDLKNRIPIKTNQKNIDEFLKIGQDWEKPKATPPKDQPGEIPGLPDLQTGETLPAPGETLKAIPGATPK